MAVRWATSLDTDDRNTLADEVRARLDGRVDHLPDLPAPDRICAVGSPADARRLLGTVSPTTLLAVAGLLAHEPDTADPDADVAEPAQVDEPAALQAEATDTADTPAPPPVAVPPTARPARRRLSAIGAAVGMLAGVATRKALSLHGR